MEARTQHLKRTDYTNILIYQYTNRILMHQYTNRMLIYRSCCCKLDHTTAERERGHYSRAIERSTPREIAWRQAQQSEQSEHTFAYVSIRQHASAYVSIRQHTSAYVSIRQHTSAYVSMRQHASAYVSVCQHTSACVSMRQHASACVSIRQHTSAYSISWRSSRASESECERDEHTPRARGIRLEA